MFNIGLPEVVVVFSVALIALGPEKLPELARTLGKWSADLRRQSDSLRREFYNEVYRPANDVREKLKSIKVKTLLELEEIEKGNPKQNLNSKDSEVNELVISENQAEDSAKESRSKDDAS